MTAILDLRPLRLERSAATASRPAPPALRDRLSGDVITPADEAYEDARKVGNRAVDKYPALIARPRTAADVAEAVTYARDHGLTVAVRSGGHSMRGQGTVDGGLVIDFSLMKEIVIDPEERVAWAQPGATWGEYGARAQEFGLITPAGDTTTVGVGGLTLGGGIGWLVRKYGLTIDSLLAVELVTAEGEQITASPEQNADLFWALRGGGGNFGVVTRFKFRLHPLGQIAGGAIFYPATADILRDLAAKATAAPEELSTINFIFQAPPLPFLPSDAHGMLIVMITACYAGDVEMGQRALAPLRSLAGQTPLADLTGPMPYMGLYDFVAEGAKPPPHYVRSGYLHALDEQTIDATLQYGHTMTSPLEMIQIRFLGGEMARVPAEATAFAHRDKSIMYTIIGIWPEPENARPARVAQHKAWVDSFWQAVAPRTDG
ncbi:MAG TPA: FAD-binding oxidoreductase, partial [Chloroflexota bacterium]|nr:FAD-binding oxidoreductase [Chloroflexota bacterium]